MADLYLNSAIPSEGSMHYVTSVVRVSAAAPSQLITPVVVLPIPTAIPQPMPRANGRVADLRLDGNQLSGSIPSELGNLANLSRAAAKRTTHWVS